MSRSKFYVNSRGEQVYFTVKVSTCPNLRSDSEKVLIPQTKELLRKMYDDFAIDPSTTCVVMEYPERWANLSELRSLPSRLLLCFPNLAKVTIKTHSPALVKATHQEHITVIDSPVDGDYWTPDEFRGLKVPDLTDLTKVKLT